MPAPMPGPVADPCRQRAGVLRLLVWLARLTGLLPLPAALLSVPLAGVLALLPVATAPARAEPSVWAGGWTPPVPAVAGTVAVARPFRAPAQRWAPGHRGVDLVAARAQQVLAPAAGTVSFVGLVVDRGVVVITHPGGLRTSLEPVSPLVPVGTAVARGQPVAVVAEDPAHCAPAACLHWGLRRGDVYLDPMLLLVRPGPSVLLPLAPARHRGAPGPA